MFRWCASAQDPFRTLLDTFDFLSPDHIWDQLDTLSCIATLSHESAFLLQSVGVPLLCCLTPVVIHMILFGRRREMKRHLLLDTLGLLCVIFITITCNSISEPFQCELHPNGLYTMRTNHEVVCNFSGAHLRLCCIGWALCLFPSLFVAFCFWIVVVELPKRLQAADMKFVQACSFLILRFRPGCEKFALVFLLRNMLFAFTPVLPGAAAS